MLELGLKYAPLKIVSFFEQHILKNFERTKTFLHEIDPNLLEEVSQRKAVAIFKLAAKTTPAYTSFLRLHHISPSSIHSIRDFDIRIPSIDKENYVKIYSLLDRCAKGKLPKTGNVDESGGTTGVATNWIHNFNEQSLLFHAANFELSYLFGTNKKECFIISAWSTGPWATGVKFCELMEKIALVKNTATDPEDIIRTLKMFGKDRNYIIGGYPPFLKNLLDGYEKEINWKEYKINLITGGEGTPLDWVYYVKSKLAADAKIVSSYGASDIDIGVGFETPLAFFIRETIARNKELRLALFKKDEVPMVFQYNPTMHYIREVNGHDGKRELEFTLLDPSAAMPKIKYNLHDEGRKLTFSEMMYLLQVYDSEFLPSFIHKAKGKEEDILHLPFICIFGRSDGTLSFDGANVFPEQIEEGILENKELAKRTNRFKIEKKYDKKHTAQFHIHIELKQKQKVSSILKRKYFNAILPHLLKVNPDFKESYIKNATLKPFINLYKFESDLFKKDDGKVKNSYFVK